MERLQFDKTELQSLKDIGMNDEQIAQLRPALVDRNMDAIDVWHAMGDWCPERIPIIVAMLGVTNIDGLLERLVTIRDALSHG